MTIKGIGEYFKQFHRRSAWDDLGASTNVLSNIFAHVKGRMFDSWVDVAPRNNGYSEGDLIENPAYIIESLLRDENFTERDLRITTVGGTDDLLTITGLASSQDDYYNGAIYYNATTGVSRLITDYAGATKIITLEDATDAAVTADDNVFITNIQGGNKIDYASFDLVGNTTDGSRGTTATKWIFGRSFAGKQDIRNILDELCFESHCELIESINPDTGLVQFKLVAIDSGSGDTWTNPAYIEGVEQIVAKLSSLDNIFTKFRLKYHYDYGKGDYLKEIYVDKNSYPTDATVLSNIEKNLCEYAEQSYVASRLFEYDSMNIYNDATAEYLLQKKIQWFTKQRLMVRVITPITGNFDWVKYERGDQVKLNFSKGIPTGLNNSSMFMITNKTITPTISGGLITWELIEL